MLIQPGTEALPLLGNETLFSLSPNITPEIVERAVYPGGPWIERITTFGSIESHISNGATISG